MKKYFVLVNILIALILMATTPALSIAGDYFGFKLGTATQSEVVELLKTDRARFDAGYSYKGVAADLLPVIKVSSFTRFSKLGNLREAWLHFDPAGNLYRISVTWNDPGDTFRAVRDGLSSKYPSNGHSGFGFNSNYRYRDGTTRIVLERSTFGFGNDQTTCLTYVHAPSEGAVKKAKGRVDQKIRAENAKRTGGDL